MSRIGDILAKYLPLRPGDRSALDQEIENLVRSAYVSSDTRAAPSNFSAGNVSIDYASGITLYNPLSGRPSVYLDNDGDAFFGQDIEDPSKTSFIVFSNEQVYNGEILGEGDVLLGDNSTNQANLVWDRSTGKMSFRGGTVEQVYVDTDGSIMAGGGVIRLDSDGIAIFSPVDNYTNPTTIKWIVGSTNYAELQHYYSTYVNQLAIEVPSVGLPSTIGLYANTGTTKIATIFLEALSGGGNNRASLTLVADSDSTDIGSMVFRANALDFMDVAQNTTVTMQPLSGDLRVGGGLYVGSTGTDPAADTLYVDGDVYIYNDKSLLFSGTSGGSSSGEGIQYKDSGGTLRYCMDFPGSDVVRVQNRASNGVVKIGANTSTAGGAGNVDVIEVQDDKVILDSGADFYTVSFTDYSGSTSLTGWAATPTVGLYYKRVGKLVYVWFNITGTSNSTSTSFTVPYTCNSSIGAFGVIRRVDNGTAGWGNFGLGSSSTTVNVRADASTGTTTWTNTGTKTIQGHFVYEA